MQCEGASLQGRHPYITGVWVRCKKIEMMCVLWLDGHPNEAMTSVHGGVPRKECDRSKMSEIYHALLELQYRDKRHKSLAAKEWEKGRRTVHPGGGTLPRCCWIWAEGSGEVNSPWLPAGPPKWRGCRVNTPDWWQELVGILGINDFQELTQKIRTSFEPPWAKIKSPGCQQQLFSTTSPQLHPLEGISATSEPHIPQPGFMEGQSQKTLAYAQALQYWVEKANPPTPSQPHLLARCVQELRRVMEPYVTFSDDAILEGATPQERSPEGWTWAPIPVETQSAPTEEPTNEPAPAEVSTEETAPT